MKKFLRALSVGELIGAILVLLLILSDIVAADVVYFLNKKGDLIKVQTTIVAKNKEIKEIKESKLKKSEKISKLAKKMLSNNSLKVNNVGYIGKYINIEAISKNVLFRESSNNYFSVNTLGFHGGYQLGIAMAEDIGLLRKGEFRRFIKMKVSQKVFFQKYAKWRNGLSAKKFLADSYLQDRCFIKSLEVNFKYLRSNGVITKNTPIKEIQGYLVAAHLKGAGAVKSWVSGKLKKTTDSYNTDIKEYFYIGYNS